MAERIPSPRANGTDKVLPTGFMQWADWAHRLLTSLMTAVADIAGLDTRVTAIEGSSRNPAGNLYEFWHLGQNGGSTTRRMFSGNLLSAQYTTAAHGNAVRRLIPYDGTLKRLMAQNPTATGGTGNTVTYTVLQSTDDGATWSSTSLTIGLTAANTVPGSVDADVSVSAGDLIVVEVTFSGAVTAIAAGEYMAAAVWFEKT